MSFGTKHPSSYTPPLGVELIPLTDEATCPVCGKDVSEHNVKAGKVAMAPCVVPKEPSQITTQRAIFACNACYNSQRTHFYGSIEEFVEAMESKRPRKARSISVTPGSTNHLEILRSIYLMLRPLFEPSSASRSVTSAPPCEIDDTDDLEFGMTPEQEARMAQAVKDAAERTKEVVIGG